MKKTLVSLILGGALLTTAPNMAEAKWRYDQALGLYWERPGESRQEGKRRRDREIAKEAKEKGYWSIEEDGKKYHIKNGVKRTTMEYITDYITDSERIQNLKSKFKNVELDLKVNALKVFPVYDPIQGKLTTFGSMMKNMAKEAGAQGMAAEDPVKLGYMIYSDTPNAWKNIKMIVNGEGKELISLYEAKASGNLTPKQKEQLEKIDTLDTEIRKQYDAGRIKNATDLSIDFFEGIKNLNKQIKGMNK